MSLNLDDKVTAVRGVGRKTEDLLHKLGVYSVRDMLLFFPRDYAVLPKISGPGELREETVCALRLRISGPLTTRRGRRMEVTQTKGTLGPLKVGLVWFRQPYLVHVLRPGDVRIFCGKTVRRGSEYVLEQPKIYEEGEYRELQKRLIPVYPVTKGLKSSQLEKLIQAALSELQDFPDDLPESLRKKRELLPFFESIRILHRPDTKEQLIMARKRMVYDEFFRFLLALNAVKVRAQKEENRFPLQKDGYLSRLIAKLPFELTGAQLRSIQEAEADLSGPLLMNRLLQGDVGSGKTIVAFLLMALSSHAGYQSAIMAPTEVLAVQHFETFRKLKEQLGLDMPVFLLTGQQKAAEKRAAKEAIREAKGALVIGTHALFQEGVEFRDLSLVITDEQHRFGVRQREALQKKGASPHVLVMSATPIPRTLALILYQDLDISVIDVLPKNRLPKKNYVVDPTYRSRIFSFIEKEVRAGHQAYVICPLVEESESVTSENVVSYTDLLRENLSPDISVEYLHGRMKSEEKNDRMERFSYGEIQVLVSTTVVEVGVNVPNATLMIVENADRFGLAQLHQLRGRVGRGSAQSYCIFINGSTEERAKERLDILAKSNDGFAIADQDLKLRGPGDFLGIRQSGEFAFGMADVFQDAGELKMAAEDVKALLVSDPELSLPEHTALHEMISRELDIQRNRINL